MRVSIDDSILTDVADAIREKTATSESISPLDFAEKIGSISGGGITLASGTLSFASQSTDEVYIEHELGVTPDLIICVRTARVTTTNLISAVMRIKDLNYVAYGVSSSPRWFAEDWIDANDESIAITPTTDKFWNGNYRWYALKIQ